MMHILYLINQYPKTSHSFIRREIAALERLGVMVTRYSIRKVCADKLVDGADRQEFRETGVLLSLFTFRKHTFAAALVLLWHPILWWGAFVFATKLGWNSKKGVVYHGIYLIEACILKQICSEKKIDHIHAHFGTNTAMVALLCRRLGGPSYSFTVHGPEEFDDPDGLALVEKVKNSRFAVVVSSYGRSQLMRYCHPKDWTKIHVIHCTVDQHFVQGNEIDFPLGPRLISVGRLSSQKGQFLLLEALSQLKGEGICFEMVLVGDGEMRSLIEQRIHDLGLGEDVTLTGWLDGEQVKEEILASRALILPSFAEGLPVVIMESFALKRPVLSTYVAGIPELVEHGQNGWLIPAGSVEALADALKKVLKTSVNELYTMGQQGAIRVAADFHDMTEAKRLVKIFSSV